MKVYILPVKEEFQPSTISIVYPPHNKGFKDAEEVYLEYLYKSVDLLTDNPNDADWHYLPILWTHWMVNHKFGTIDLNKLQAEISRVILDYSKTYTIHEYAEQPKIDIGGMIVFLGSRTSNKGIDVPLLCALHPIQEIPSEKKYLASFVGSMTTHPIRDEVFEKLKYRDDVLVTGGGDINYFVDIMLSSYIALCPRGYGGASYRFYEAMQLGIVPFLIGDIDHRPFKSFLPWDEVSLYAKYVEDIERLIDYHSKQKLIVMGDKAKQFYKKEFVDGNWCKYILKELEKL